MAGHHQRQRSGELRGQVGHARAAALSHQGDQFVGVGGDGGLQPLRLGVTGILEGLERRVPRRAQPSVTGTALDEHVVDLERRAERPVGGYLARRAGPPVLQPLRPAVVVLEHPQRLPVAEDQPGGHTEQVDRCDGTVPPPQPFVHE